MVYWSKTVRVYKDINDIISNHRVALKKLQLTAELRWEFCDS